MLVLKFEIRKLALPESEVRCNPDALLVPANHIQRLQIIQSDARAESLRELVINEGVKSPGIVIDMDKVGAVLKINFILPFDFLAFRQEPVEGRITAKDLDAVAVFPFGVGRRIFVTEQSGPTQLKIGIVGRLKKSLPVGVEDRPA